MKLISSASISRRHPYKAASASPHPPLTKKSHLLVVDDDENARDLQKILLHTAGYVVDTAADGEEAWKMLRAKPYDLLLTDQKLPGITGLELVGRLRAAEMALPAIINSGWPDMGKVSDYPNLALSAILDKPVNFAKVLVAVREALHSQNAEGKANAMVDRRPGWSPQQDQTSTQATHDEPAKELHNRILIADDDPVLRDSLASVLELEGYSVDEAGNGRDAVSHANARRPDLALLDLKMPQLDGWTVFSQLDRITPPFPVIFITGLSDQYQKALQTGADALMEKPLNISILLRAIRQLITEGTSRRGQSMTDHPPVTKLLNSNYS